MRSSVFVLVLLLSRSPAMAKDSPSVQTLDGTGRLLSLRAVPSRTPAGGNRFVLELCSTGTGGWGCAIMQGSASDGAPEILRLAVHKGRVVVLQVADGRTRVAFWRPDGRAEWATILERGAGPESFQGAHLIVLEPGAAAEADAAAGPAGRLAVHVLLEDAQEPGVIWYASAAADSGFVGLSARPLWGGDGDEAEAGRPVCCLSRPLAVEALGGVGAAIRVEARDVSRSTGVVLEISFRAPATAGLVGVAVAEAEARLRKPMARIVYETPIPQLAGGAVEVLLSPAGNPTYWWCENGGVAFVRGTGEGGYVGPEVARPAEAVELIRALATKQ